MDIDNTNLIKTISILKKNESAIIEKNIYKNTHSSNNSPYRNQSSGCNVKNIWVRAYGCSANMADSEIIRGALEKQGYNIVDEENTSDLNILVTCSVKDSTEHKILHQIDNLTNRGKPLVVAGCLPKTEREKIERINPTASLIGPNSLSRISDVVALAKLSRRGVFLNDSNSEKVNLPRIRINKIVSIIEIASGCLSQCSFCQTKIAKGWLKSYRNGSIIRQLESDVNEGCKEIWLTSTDNGCYGRDINSNLVELLERCSYLPGPHKIRVGMMNPMYLSDLSDGLLQLFKKSEKMYKFLHIPVQSGSEKILKRMFRGHDADTFKDIVLKFRREIPEITIATDIIVGFPGESEDDFNSTIDLIQMTQPDIVNISKYSSRSDTPASRYKKVRSDIIKHRSEILHNVCGSISRKRNSLWKNWKGELLINEINNKDFQGRNYAYKSVIIKDVDSHIEIGDTVKVKISNYSKYSLLADLIN
ncbi:MAG: tRNA (N(6)-L-threonylcarbamoyladenosine(37)-C(2))-methylthiotransferase [Nitrososphaeraceae archaeon]